MATCKAPAKPESSLVVRLDQWMRKHRPAFYNALGPGAKSGALVSAEDARDVMRELGELLCRCQPEDAWGPEPACWRAPTYRDAAGGSSLLPPVLG